MVLLLWFTSSVVVVCLSMYVLVEFLFWIAVWPSFGKEIVLLAFCLLDCGVVALSAFFFFFFCSLGRKVLGNCITKAYLYNFYPLKLHFCIVKLGFTGIYISFLISAQNIDCEYSLEPPRRGGSNEYPQSMFWAEIRTKIWIFIWFFSFFGGKIFSIFE